MDSKISASSTIIRVGVGVWKDRVVCIPGHLVQGDFDVTGHIHCLKTHQCLTNSPSEVIDKGQAPKRGIKVLDIVCPAGL